MSQVDYPSLLPAVIATAKQAGASILGHYQADTSVKVTLKADNSPVTPADIDSNQIIEQGLAQLSHRWPILSEETVIPPYSEREHWAHYWCVDPLDGTKGFLRRTDDFVVCIALIERQQPVIGVIYSPVSDVTYYGCRGKKAYKQQGSNEPETIQVRPVRLTDLTVARSRYHPSEKLSHIMKTLKIKQINLGSAIKSCLVAEGLADIYPRLGPTYEWDTAAAQCILEQAGGQLIDLHGQPLRYNTQDSVENPNFLAVGDVSHPWLDLFREEK